MPKTKQPSKPPTLAQQLRQGLLSSVQGLQRLRTAGQLERELKAQYARLGQLYTDERPQQELETVRQHILQLRALQGSADRIGSIDSVGSVNNVTPQPPAQAAFSAVPTPAPPIAGMAARIWQAKEEERDEGEGEGAE